jgi:predicted alpha/beta superfamily hydrolase
MKQINFILPVFFLFIISCTSDQTEPLPGITGTVVHYENFASEFVAPRNLDIWLPPSYDDETQKRYPVVYMHDGQNLFNPETSFIGVDWGVDEAMTKLIGEGKIRKAIVIGIWNTPRRYYEYLPQRPIHEMVEQGFLDLEKEGIEMPESDDYLTFIVDELKPYIDANYRTLPGKHDTSVMGASMGALISLYALCEHPDVFGGAGCVSTHWPVGEGYVLHYLQNHIPVPGEHKFYFDYGTETLDSLYEPFQIKADVILREAGYMESDDWLTIKFEGHEHSERAWRKRVHIPLEFLIGQ